MDGNRLRAIPNFAAAAVHSACSDPGPYADLRRTLSGRPSGSPGAAASTPWSRSLRR